MRKSILVLFVIFCFGHNCISQIRATTTEGKEVILKDNGTWEVIKKNFDDKSSISMDCSNLISINEDKVTGNSSKSANEMLLVSKDEGKTGFGIFVMSVSDAVVLNIQAVGAGKCIDDDDKMNVLFRDGTRLAVENDTDFNCDSEYRKYLGGKLGSKKALEEFKNKEVETMRIWTSDGFVEENFTSEQSQVLRQLVACLSQ